MAGDLNEVSLIGRLGQDPEVKSFQNGGRICNLRVATSESWKDRQTGERKERTEWHSVTISNDGLIGVAERYLRKGSRVFLRGQLQTRKWQDRDGHDRYTTEIVLRGYGGSMIMLDSAQGRQPQGGGEASGNPGRQQGGWNSGAGAGATGEQRWGGGHSSSSGSFADDLDDDIPF